MRREKRWTAAVGGVLFPLAAVVAALWFFTALSELRQGRDTEDRRQLENAIRRSAVACYAAEGVYPPTLEYLEEHYGVQIDEKRYTVDYGAFAENLIPAITVLENEP